MGFPHITLELFQFLTGKLIQIQNDCVSTECLAMLLTKIRERLKLSFQEKSFRWNTITVIVFLCNVAVYKGRGYNFYLLVSCGRILFNSHVTYDVTFCTYDVTSGT